MSSADCVIRPLSHAEPTFFEAALHLKSQPLARWASGSNSRRSSCLHTHALRSTSHSVSTTPAHVHGVRTPALARTLKQPSSPCLPRIRQHNTLRSEKSTLRKAHRPYRALPNRTNLHMKTSRLLRRNQKANRSLIRKTLLINTRQSLLPNLRLIKTMRSPVAGRTPAMIPPTAISLWPNQRRQGKARLPTVASTRCHRKSITSTKEQPTAWQHL